MDPEERAFSLESEERLTATLFVEEIVNKSINDLEVFVQSRDTLFMSHEDLSINQR